MTLCLLQWLGEGDLDRITTRVGQTARWADSNTVRRLLIPCFTKGHCLKQLESLDPHYCHAELLPHLGDIAERITYICHCIGLLLNRLFITAPVVTGSLSTSDPGHSLASSHTLCGPAIHRAVQLVLRSIIHNMRRNTRIALARDRTCNPLAEAFIRDPDGNEEAAVMMLQRWMSSVMSKGNEMPRMRANGTGYVQKWGFVFARCGPRISLNP